MRPLLDILARQAPNHLVRPLLDILAGEPEDRPAGGGQDAVAARVVAPARRARVAGPVDLDDQPSLRPVEVDLLAEHLRVHERLLDAGALGQAEKGPLVAALRAGAAVHVRVDRFVEHGGGGARWRARSRHASPQGRTGCDTPPRRSRSSVRRDSITSVRSTSRRGTVVTGMPRRVDDVARIERAAAMQLDRRHAAEGDAWSGRRFSARVARQTFQRIAAERWLSTAPGPPGEHRDHPPGLARQPVVPDGVDAGRDPEQAALRDPAADRASFEPG